MCGNGAGLEQCSVLPGDRCCGWRSPSCPSRGGRAPEGPRGLGRRSPAPAGLGPEHGTCISWKPLSCPLLVAARRGEAVLVWRAAPVAAGQSRCPPPEPPGCRREARCSPRPRCAPQPARGAPAHGPCAAEGRGSLLLECRWDN